MKKIKVNSESFNEILKQLESRWYSFKVSPSINVKWVLIDEENKTIRFEYGDDAYPDYELIEVSDLSVTKIDVNFVRGLFEKQSGNKAVVINSSAYPTEHYFKWLEELAIATYTDIKEWLKTIEEEYKSFMKKLV